MTAALVPAADPRPIFAYWYGEWSYGGIETALVALFKTLDLTRVRPIFVWAGPRNEPRLVRELREIGIETVQIQPLPGTTFRRIARIRFAARWLKEVRPTLLHIHASSALSDGAAIAAARLLGIPVVRTVHAPFSWFPPNQEVIRRGWQRALHGFLTSGVSRAIAVSSADHAELLRSGLFKAEQVVTLANGIPRAQFARPLPLREAKARLGLDPEAMVIGAVGRLEMQKQMGRAIAALPAVLRELPAARLVLVGEGADEAALRAQARELGVAAQVIFLGHRTDMPECLAAFDVLAIPSLYESQGLIFLEGLAASVPVVASDLACFREMDAGAGAALFVDTADAQVFAGAILRLLGDEALRARQIAAGHSRVAHYTIEAHAAQLRALYDTVLAERGGQGAR